MCRFVGCHAFPPHVTIWSERSICVNAVAPQCVHRVGIGVITSTRCNTKESCFRIDCIQLTVFCKFHPTYVVANCFGFPTRNRWNEHRKIGLATCRRKRRSDVFVSTLRVGEFKNQHVLSQPAIVTCHHAGNAQRKALFAQERIATIARAVAPDFASVGEVGNVFVVGVARPRRVFLTSFEWRANRVQAWHPLIVTKSIQCALTHASHDAHADCDIRTVGELYTDMCNWRTEWTHRKRNDVHDASTHCTCIQTLQLCTHFRWFAPVVGRSCINFMS